MAGLLSSFYFAFAGDASKLDKSLDDSDKKIDKLEQHLEGADKAAKELGSAFIDLAKKAGEGLAAIMALGAIKKLTQDTADHTFAVGQEAKALTMSVSALSAWQQAVVSQGGTAQGATAALTGLRDTFVSLATMPGSMSGNGFMLERLGLTREDMQAGIKDPTVALQKLAGTFEHLDAVQQQFVGKKLGFDQGTIAVLAQGRRGFDELIAKQHEYGTVTKEQAENAAKFKLAQASLGITFETVARQLTGALLPPVTWLFQKLDAGVGVLERHKPFVMAFFTGIAVVLADVLVPAAIAGGVALFTFLAPIIAIPLLIGAVVAGIALLADDLYAFMAGHNSMIGEAAKKWPLLGEAIRAVVGIVGSSLKVLNATIKDTWKYLVDLFQFVVDVITNGPSKALDAFNKRTKDTFDDLLGHFKGLSDAVGKGWDLITGKSTPAAPLGATNAPPDAVAAANAAQAKYGVPAAVTLAQYKLESGNGAHMPAGSNNPFGIKARAGQPYVEAMTTEHQNGQDVRVMQKFAKFDSLTDAFDAHAKLLATGSAYANARQHTDNPDAYADALTGKYATDPKYGDKLKQIMAQQRVQGGVQAGQVMLAQANGPVSTTNSNVISNSMSRSRNTNIDVGGVTVQTASSDPKAVGADLSTHLQKHITNAQNGADDGIVA